MHFYRLFAACHFCWLSAFIMSIAVCQATKDLEDLCERYRKAETALERIAALEAIAAKQVSREVPSEEVTNALALGLKDPDYSVRIRTVELLDESQHAGATIRKLLLAIDDIKKEIMQLAGDKKKKLDDQKKAHSKIKAKKKPSGEDIRESVNAFLSSYSDLVDFYEKAKKLLEVRDVIVLRLAKMPDDRSVKTIAKLIEEPIFSEQSTAQVEALLELGNRTAVKSVVDVIVKWEREARELERELKKLQKTRHRKKPYESMSDKEWKEKEKKRIAEKCSAFEKETLKKAGWVNSVSSRLHEFAVKKNLISPPVKIVPGRYWSQWYCKIEESLPDELGTYSPNYGESGNPRSGESNT